MAVQRKWEQKSSAAQQATTAATNYDNVICNRQLGEVARSVSFSFSSSITLVSLISPNPCFHVSCWGYQRLSRSSTKNRYQNKLFGWFIPHSPEMRKKKWKRLIYAVILGSHCIDFKLCGQQEECQEEHLFMRCDRHRERVRKSRDGRPKMQKMRVQRISINFGNKMYVYPH